MKSRVKREKEWERTRRWRWWCCWRRWWSLTLSGRKTAAALVPLQLRALEKCIVQASTLYKPPWIAEHAAARLSAICNQQVPVAIDNNNNNNAGRSSFELYKSLFFQMLSHVSTNTSKLSANSLHLVELIFVFHFKKGKWPVFYFRIIFG